MTWAGTESASGRACLITSGSIATSRFGCIMCFCAFMQVFFDTFFTPISVQRVNGRDARRNGRRSSCKGIVIVVFYPDLKRMNIE